MMKVLQLQIQTMEVKKLTEKIMLSEGITSSMMSERMTSLTETSRRGGGRKRLSTTRIEA